MIILLFVVNVIKFDFEKKSKRSYILGQRGTSQLTLDAHALQKTSTVNQHDYTCIKLALTVPNAYHDTPQS